MQGDFSRWDEIGGRNLGGVLHQQGRVLLDRDWNDQTRLTHDWQDRSARDVIGAGVLAVSSHRPDAFRVTAARVDGGEVIVTLLGGLAWADGLPVLLPDGGAPVERVARYFDADVQPVPGTVAEIEPGVRDAVILEVWREALNAFQVPAELLEPALGGPDTTERVLTAMRLRLFRLDDEEDCHSISLADQPLGNLRASLRPAVVVGGDCPVPDEGGYTGFEHHLYRIEIARVNDAATWFKWSRFNGGLVGRGDAQLGDPANRRFSLTANAQPIRTSGLTDFYLEVVAHDDELGHWRVTYGAEVTLDGDDLRVVTEHYTEAARPTGNTFFRLWDGIRPTADFPEGPDPDELEDNILLEFEAAGALYRPGGYWSFPVRAGGIANPTVLVDAPPEGIRYHRVPLAELTWDADRSVTLDEGQIEDCRRPFRPLTDQRGCCTFSVGDGVGSHGDFDSVEEAVRHLPAAGGKVCLLPGVHRANVRIEERQNLEISGCGRRTLVMPREDQEDEPIFRIAASQGIHLHNLTLLTNTGTAVQVLDPLERGEPSREIHLLHNRIIAGVHAVEVRPRNQEAGDNDIRIAHNLIGILDTEQGRAAILVSADSVLIERNRLVVVPAPDPDDPTDPRDPDSPGGEVFDPCADPIRIYRRYYGVLTYVHATLAYIVAAGVAPRVQYRALGGIQVAGGSERVRILENEILGGRGHGITLGELPQPREQGEFETPFDAFFIEEAPPWLTREFVAVVYEVAIEGNVIQGMGMCGVGVVAFFHPERAGLLMRAEGLAVHRNRIEQCVRQPPEIPASLRRYAGLGGIALADCALASFRENRIRDNGRETIEPVCGLFVLAGDRVEIMDNHILNNGPSAAEERETLRPMHRAGILVLLALSRLGTVFARDLPPPRDGIPAVRVHDNVVTQPIGQALVIGAMGPVSVTGNSLTSQDADLRAAPLSLLAGTVFIFNLGISKDLLATMVFAGYRRMGAINVGLSQNVAEQSLSLLARLLLLPSGAVLFTDNQVTLDLREQRTSFALSSVMIVSLDDIAFNDNQTECTSWLDLVLVNTVLLAPTVRSSDNRFQEGVTFVFWSLLSLGMMNTASLNQSTHCLQVLGPAAFLVKFGNRVLFNTNCDESALRLEQGLGATEGHRVFLAQEGMNQ